MQREINQLQGERKLREMVPQETQWHSVQKYQTCFATGSTWQFLLPGISDNNLLALRPTILCQSSEMTSWQSGSNALKKYKIMSPPYYIFQ